MNKNIEVNLIYSKGKDVEVKITSMFVNSAVETETEPSSQEKLLKLWSYYLFMTQRAGVKRTFNSREDATSVPRHRTEIVANVNN